MPRLLFLILLLGSSVTMTRSQPIVGALGESITRIVAAPIALDPEGGRRAVGALRFISGYELRSADPRFGGISALVLTRDGFLALGDGGTAMWLTGRRPTGLRLLPLPAGPGDSAGKRDRDSEAMTGDERGRLWIAYERHDSIWRYGPGLRRAEAGRKPPEMQRWRNNSGAEGMVRLKDGRFLVFSEGRGAVPRSSDLLLFDRDPTDPGARAVRMSYRLPQGFRVTDAALLGDGRVITLHRSASIADGLAASVGIAELAAFSAGAVVAPRIVATLRSPLNVDNMEALAVETASGRARIWIVSDDNFSALQRTLLMQFELEEGGSQ